MKRLGTLTGFLGMDHYLFEGWVVVFLTSRMCMNFSWRAIACSSIFLKFDTQDLESRNHLTALLIFSFSQRLSLHVFEQFLLREFF